MKRWSRRKDDNKYGIPKTTQPDNMGFSPMCKIVHISSFELGYPNFKTC